MQWCPLFASNFIKACGTWAKPRNRESELVTAVALYAYSETITELERTRTNQYQDFLVPVFDFVRSVGRSVTADQKCTVWSPIWTIASSEATKVCRKWLWKFAFDCWQNVAFKRPQNGSASQQQKCLTACLLHWPASVLHSASDQFVATVIISSPIQEIATYVYLAFLCSFSQFSRGDRFQKTPFKMFSVHTKTG